jgi:hypothetical protein
MTQLHPSPTCPGHWRLGERELAHGDVIEVLILGKWYTAAICHDLTASLGTQPSSPTLHRGPTPATEEVQTPPLGYDPRLGEILTREEPE